MAEKNPISPSGVAMEPADIPQSAAQTSSVVPAPPGLKIAGIYQDVARRAWIGDLWNRVADLAGPDAVPITAWSLEELSRAPAFQEAVSAAVVADVLVISIHAGDHLPPVLCAWIDSWRPRRQRHGGSLIVLLGVAAGQPEIPLARAKDYLSAIARGSGLDFQFCEHLDAPHCPETTAPDRASSPETNPLHQPDQPASAASD
jgi:hypothetical protein